ncbi:F0F1 ATP synthase subunit A [Sneathia vaginalis]|uniref:F0F1 ATP synthase subunit A n=1 Tax=Sneathia vaginalis TaxID=187101 RepID=UPI0035C734B7
MKKAGKVILYFIVITLIINFILGIFSTIFPISFLKPSDLIEAPRVFGIVKIGRYVFQINQTIVNSWALMLLIIVILFFGSRNLSIENPKGLQLLLEEYYNFIESTFLANYKNYKEKFLPFFSALFAFILFSNLSVFLLPYIFMWEKKGNTWLIKPFFRTATADINTTLGLAIIVTVLFVTCWIKRQGIIGVFKELCHPFFIMLPINIIGELAKPINISMRLFGNMFAGLVIIGLLYGISFNNVLSSLTLHLMRGSFSLAVIWPAILQLYLDLFIGILQAFVFTVLSSVYVEQALIGDED